MTFDKNHKIDEVDVVNGKEGWVKVGDYATENLGVEHIESDRDGMFVNWVPTGLVPLKAAGFRLSLVEETSVAGRKAVGIRVSHDKHDPRTLFFDKETHLLLKYQRKYKLWDSGGEVDAEYVFSDFRNVQNLKVPFKMEFYWAGKNSNDQLLSDMKFYDKPLDEKLFSKP